MIKTTYNIPESDAQYANMDHLIERIKHDADHLPDHDDAGQLIFKYLSENNFENIFDVDLDLIPEIMLEKQNLIDKLKPVLAHTDYVEPRDIIDELNASYGY